MIFIIFQPPPPTPSYNRNYPKCNDDDGRPLIWINVDEVSRDPNILIHVVWALLDH